MSTEASIREIVPIELLQKIMHPTTTQVLLLLALWPIYYLTKVFYRLYLSPLSNIPGDRLAAATSLYAFYHDVYRGGQYIWEIERMHKQYGPIVRIRPDIIHFNDPEFIDQIFTGAGKRRDKGQVTINGLAAKGSGLGTKKHDLHKMRRAALNPFFSKQSIRREEAMLQRVIQKLLNRLDQCSVSGVPMNLKNLNQAASSDMINEYSFGKSTNNIDKEDLNGPAFNAMEDACRDYHLATYLPWLPDLFRAAPQSLLLALIPKLEVWLELLKFFQSRLDYVKSTKGRNDTTTIFHGMLEGNLPEEEKSTSRLLDEARAIIGAGTDTTSHTVTNITFHLLANPDILKRLREELQTALPDPNVLPTLQQVETLPYFSAIIREGLRLHPAAAVRQERVATDEDLTYTNKATGETYLIPRGNSMAMTALLLSRSPEIYDSPYLFLPERFLDNPRLIRHELTFSRGTRRCLGENLAYAEMYLILASVFRKYDVYDPVAAGKQGPTLELYETTRERDLDPVADFVFAMPAKESVGIRVMVRG